MKNFIQNGDILELSTPYDRLSGQGALVGAIFGVATADYTTGTNGQYLVSGVVELNKATADVVTQGAKLYWANTPKEVTIISSGNTLIGVAVVPAANGTTTVNVRLNGSF